MSERDIHINTDLNTPKGVLKKDSTIAIQVDSDGVPLDRFWRARLRDSAIDNCVSLLPKKLTKKGKVENGSSISKSNS